MTQKGNTVLSAPEVLDPQLDAAASQAKADHGNSPAEAWAKERRARPVTPVRAIPLGPKPDDADTLHGWIALHYDEVGGSGNTLCADCPCPTHSRKRPPQGSLRFFIRNNRVIVSCLGGCRTEDILGVRGLTVRDLQPRDDGPDRAATVRTPPAVAPTADDADPQRRGDSPLPADDTHHQETLPVSSALHTHAQTLDDQRDELGDNDTEDDVPADTTAGEPNADAADPHAADVVPDTDADAEPRTPPTAPDPAWLDDLAEQWQAQRRDDLAVRHRTDALINGEIGPPGRRQPRGKGVIQAVTTRLNVSVSEVSRMRAFVARFPSFDAFRDKHPDVHTWSAVKPLITAPKKPTQGANNPKRDLSAVIRSVDGMRKRVEALAGYAPQAEQRQQLTDVLTDLAEALPTSLGVRIDVKQAKLEEGQDSAVGDRPTPADAPRARKRKD